MRTNRYRPNWRDFRILTINCEPVLHISDIKDGLNIEYKTDNMLLKFMSALLVQTVTTLLPHVMEICFF